MRDLTDFATYENEAIFDRRRQLRWSFAAMVYSVEYARAMGIGETVDDVMNATRKGNLHGMMALLYGALKAAAPAMTLKRFYDIYKSEHLAEYMAAVADGIAHFRPKDTGDDGSDLDESYPDTQAEVKKKKPTRKRTGARGTTTRVEPTE